MYIDCRIVPQKDLINALLEKNGTPYANQMVAEWFDRYEGFYIDIDKAEILFFKKRVIGYWEVNEKIIDNYLFKK